MFDPTVDFTEAELQIINASYATVPALREFWAKFPDLSLEAAIGGLKGEEAAKEAGKEVAPVPEEAPVCEAPVQEKSSEESAAAE